jgi:uncharacterized protein involved in exopolysaccharide biosynthesis
MAPPYQAFSLLRIEPSAPPLFGKVGPRDNETSMAYIRTQTQLIKSDVVLSVAIANPLVSPLPLIRESDDPRNDLRENLSVEIVPDTYLIRVALKSQDATEAATIVNAVVASYKEHIEQSAQSYNRRLREGLERQERNLQMKVAEVQRDLKTLAQNSTVGVAGGKGEIDQDTLEANSLNHLLTRLEARQDLVENHLAQLAFESNQESFRVVLVDPAAIPKVPANNHRTTFMAATPVVVFLLVFGVFVVIEIISGRPDRRTSTSRKHLMADVSEFLETEPYPFNR